MITPLVEEETWRSRLDALPEWALPSDPVLVVSPHPDDETLGAGGLIAMLRERGVPVAVVAVTDGERAYGETPGLGELREQEQTAACSELGVALTDVRRLRLTDSGLGAEEAALEARLEGMAQSGGWMVAPWPKDFHPDHEVCGRVAERVARRHGMRVLFYFFWTWHRGTPELLEGLDLVRLKLTPAARSAKGRALAWHRSQLEHVSGEPILPEYLLGPMQRSYEVFLPA